MDTIKFLLIIIITEVTIVTISFSSCSNTSIITCKFLDDNRSIKSSIFQFYGMLYGVMFTITYPSTWTWTWSMRSFCLGERCRLSSRPHTSRRRRRRRRTVRVLHSLACDLGGSRSSLIYFFCFVHEKQSPECLCHVLSLYCCAYPGRKEWPLRFLSQHNRPNNRHPKSFSPMRTDTFSSAMIHGQNCECCCCCCWCWDDVAGVHSHLSSVSCIDSSYKALTKQASDPTKRPRRSQRQKQAAGRTTV